MANWYYKKHFVPKKIFVIKMRNEVNNEITELSSYNFKDYQTAVETLKDHLISERVNLMKKEYDINTDMTTILKGFIEVFEKTDDKISNEPIKVYNYNF